GTGLASLPYPRPSRPTSPACPQSGAARRPLLAPGGLPPPTRRRPGAGGRDHGGVDRPAAALPRTGRPSPLGGQFAPSRAGIPSRGAPPPRRPRRRRADALRPPRAGTRGDAAPRSGGAGETSGTLPARPVRRAAATAAQRPGQRLARRRHRPALGGRP